MDIILSQDSNSIRNLGSSIKVFFYNIPFPFLFNPEIIRRWEVGDSVENGFIELVRSEIGGNTPITQSVQKNFEHFRKTEFRIF